MHCTLGVLKSECIPQDCYNIPDPDHPLIVIKPDPYQSYRDHVKVINGPYETFIMHIHVGSCKISPIWYTALVDCTWHDRKAHSTVQHCM
jgi:hypothetical protein